MVPPRTCRISAAGLRPPTFASWSNQQSLVRLMLLEPCVPNLSSCSVVCCGFGSPKSRRATASSCTECRDLIMARSRRNRPRRPTHVMRRLSRRWGGLSGGGGFGVALGGADAAPQPHVAHAIALAHLCRGQPAFGGRVGAEAAEARQGRSHRRARRR